MKKLEEKEISVGEAKVLKELEEYYKKIVNEGWKQRSQDDAMPQYASFESTDNPQVLIKISAHEKDYYMEVCIGDWKNVQGAYWGESESEFDNDLKAIKEKFVGDKPAEGDDGQQEMFEAVYKMSH